MKSRISGVDVNGWRDAAARNWDPEEFESQGELVTLLDGGAGSVAVRTASVDGERWVGGPQAAIAPHGRGRGWGQRLGGEERRREIADACDALTTERAPQHSLAYAAAVDAMARGSAQAVLAVPDVQAFGEAAQGHVLGLFKSSRRAHRLLWRPVAAFLHAMQTGAIPNASEDKTYRFLIHAGNGFEVQDLRLRRDVDRPSHLAPERQGPGELVHSVPGVRELIQRVQALVNHANPILAEQPTERSRLALKLLLQSVEIGETEVLRHDNGGWLEVVAPPLETENIMPELAEPAVRALAKSDGIEAHFLLTPLAPRWRDRLIAQLGAFIPNLRPLEWDGLARGCLVAGELIDRGLPHYFDRLTPIGLAVLEASTGEPRFVDLIDVEATLPANREYISPPFDTLEWQAGKKDLAFYVLKGANEVRHWRAELETPPPRNVAIELRLRQTPGQSWARLLLSSPEWEPLRRAPIMLDWAGLEPVQETPEEVLEKLRLPPPTVPNRIVEPPHLDLWQGSNNLRGLIDVMRSMERKGSYDLGALASALARAYRPPIGGGRHWTVGTDGDFPERLPIEHAERLRKILALCEAKIVGETLRRPLGDNHALRCATWVFALSPESVQEHLVRAIEDDFRGRRNALLEGALKRRRVVIQGAGRAVTGTQRLSRVLEVLACMSPSADTLNALAMILSRRREAPAALTRERVERLAELLSKELLSLARRKSFKLRFRNALSALAGLFRYREIERYSLLAQRDPVAEKLQAQLGSLATQLESERTGVPLFSERMTVLNNIKDYLRGQGDPDILIQIEDLGSDEEDGQD